MITLNREEIEAALGEVDDELAAELLATGASAEELRAALDELRAELELGEAIPRSSAHGGALRDLLLALEARERAEDD